MRSSLLWSTAIATVLATPDAWDDNDDAADGLDLLRAARLESRVQTAHGVLGCLAFALFFPMGAILTRIFPRRLTVWVHAAWQIVTWCMALAAMSMGIWIAYDTSYMQTYHAIIGLVAVSGLVLQPLTGLVQHMHFKKHGGRSPLSYIHVWWGIPLISLGAINGGFGLDLAGEKRVYMIVYGVFAGVIWLLWMLISIWSQYLRGSKDVAAQAHDKDPTTKVADSRD